MQQQQAMASASSSSWRPPGCATMPSNMVPMLPLRSPNALWEPGFQGAPCFAPVFPDDFFIQPGVLIEQMPENDTQESISWLTKFCSRADSILNGFQKMIKQECSSSCVLVSCPFDYRHTMPASALLQHSLHCPSSQVGLDEDAARLVASLDYLRNRDQSEDPPGTSEHSDAFSSGAQFWYHDAPAPVIATGNHANVLIRDLPPCIKVELMSEVEYSVGSEELEKFLPSQCWVLQQEVKAWTDLPRHYSWNVLMSALRTKMDKQKTTDWLLVNSVHHGVVLDPVLACHIFVLVKLLFAAIRREALTLWSHGRHSKFRTAKFDCPVLLESGSWLISQLASLYQPSSAGAFVLGLLQYMFILSARASALEDLAETGNQTQDTEAETSTNTQPEPSDVDLAFEALHERTNLEVYLKTRAYMNNLTKTQYLEDYDVLVANAAEERQRRPGYRPILEHDGLVWHRQQNQDSSKAKTKEELLAEERDYKRRRMSYRGKKVRRTAAEVLRGIIENHMEEIVAAGGIGSFKSQMLPDSTHKESEFTRRKDDGNDRTGYQRTVRDKHSQSNKYERNSRKNHINEDKQHDVRGHSDGYDHMYKRDSRKDLQVQPKEHVRSHDKYTSNTKRSTSRHSRWENEADEHRRR